MDAGHIKFTYMMPPKSDEKIRSVKIYSSRSITGFEFRDKDKLTVCKIGFINSWNVTTTELAHDEVIIGVMANLLPESKSRYTNFQFQIATKH